MKINILGAGTWGVTLGCLLQQNDLNNIITIWQRDLLKSNTISKNRLHPYLKNSKISEKINFTSNLDDLDFNALTIIAVPSSAISDVLSKCPLRDGNYIIVSKGFDINTGLLPSDLLKSSFNIGNDNIAVLSGPNHAEEIVIGKASAAVIASKNLDYSKELQNLFSSDVFRVYTSNDVIGVQIGAAIKNVIAIASGLCIGLELGDNTQAALVSRGMNEITSLDTIYKISARTLYGLSGLGDLIATCYSEHSRNRQLGVFLAKGYSLDESKDKIGMVSEGINTCQILYKISNEYKLDMPICSEVYKILFDGGDPKKSLHQLMTRSLKVENNKE